MTVLNILVLLTALAASLAAFGGETWKKGEEPIRSRITPRGWLALFCLALAFSLGITKELYGQSLAASAAEEAKAKEARLKAKLDEAGQEIRRLRPALEHALQIATEGIPREIDYPFYSAEPGAERGIVRSTSGEPLKLFAGQTLTYYVPGDISDETYIRIGQRRYPLLSNRGEITVIGAPGQPMDVEVIHPVSSDPYHGFQTKMVIRQGLRLNMRVRAAGPVDSSKTLSSVHQVLSQVVNE